MKIHYIRRLKQTYTRYSYTYTKHTTQIHVYTHKDNTDIYIILDGVFMMDIYVNIMKCSNIKLSVLI